MTPQWHTIARVVCRRMSANLYTADLDSLGRTEIYAAIEALLRLKLTTDLKHDQFRSVLAHIRQCAPCFDELREIRRKAKANIHKVGHGGKDDVYSRCRPRSRR